MAAIRFRANLRTLFRAPKWWAVLALGLLGASPLDSESVTLTTYYPAPSGIYSQMIVTDSAYFARDGGNVGVRAPSTWSPGHRLETAWPIRASRYYFDNNTSAYISPSAGANGLGFFTNSAEKLTIDASGRVGIGNTEPTHSSAANLLLQVGDGVAIAGVRVRQTECGVYTFTAGQTCQDATFTGTGQACGSDTYCYRTSQGGVRTDSTAAIPIGFAMTLLCCPCGVIGVDPCP